MIRQDLFRRAALEHVAQEKWGRPIALMPTSWWLLSIFFCSFAIAVIIFLSVTSVARKEAAVGILKLSQGELRLLPPKAGFVKEVFVTDGQDVEAGAALATISTAQNLFEGGTVDAQLLDAIEHEELALEQKRDALDLSAPLEEKALTERLAGLRNQIQLLTSERPVRQQRIEAARDAYHAGERFFANGTISENDLRQRHYDLLAQLQAQNDFQAQIAQLTAQAAETAANLAKLPSDLAQSRATLQQEIVALREKKSDVEAQGGYVLTAKIAGHVTALQMAAGQSVEPSKALLTLIPHGSRLEAEIFVPSRAIGFIKPGMPVRLLYEAFPHERFGAAHGIVSRISDTVLRPEDIGDAVSVKEPVYRVVVTPERLTVDAYGVEVPLISGMALTADIVLESRSFLALFFEPLIAARGRILGD